MKLLDVVRMALHNLWSRKLRTILNLVGIVIGCVMLMMTFAGTRGVRTGLMSIINSSDEARNFMIYPGYKKGVEPPDEAIQVVGEMSEDRRERLQKRLRRRWLNKNARQTGFDLNTVEEIRAFEHVEYVAVQKRVNLTIKLGKKRTRGSVNGIVGSEPSAIERLIAGEMVKENDADGILLTEFTAFDLGYQTDEQLQSLIGREVEMNLILDHGEMTFLAGLAVRASSGDINQSETMIGAFSKLMKDLDSTRLSENEKKLLRKVFKNANTFDPSEKIVFRRKMKIRGIVSQSKRRDLLYLLRMFVIGKQDNVLTDYREFEKINQEIKPDTKYWHLVAKVDDIRNLEGVIEKLENEGHQTHSIVFIVKRIDTEVRKVRIAISVIALLILVIVAVGISNTMVIAVLERTPEFGIMKAVGARGADILRLIIFEGALTGLVGAITACLISFALSGMIDDIVRKYVSSRLRNEYTAELFLFSPLDLAMVFLIAIVICSIASLLPAFRAARLDPVVAMRRG